MKQMLIMRKSHILLLVENECPYVQYTCPHFVTPHMRMIIVFTCQCAINLYISIVDAKAQNKIMIQVNRHV